jgi:hypothetical protein
LAYQSAQKPGKSHSSRPITKIFISRILRDEACEVTGAKVVEIETAPGLEGGTTLTPPRALLAPESQSWSATVMALAMIYPEPEKGGRGKKSAALNCAETLSKPARFWQLWLACRTQEEIGAEVGLNPTDKNLRISGNSADLPENQNPSPSTWQTSTRRSTMSGSSRRSPAATTTTEAPRRKVCGRLHQPAATLPASGSAA